MDANNLKHQFQAKIYKTGINWAVDVPQEIINHFVREKGYIRIKGRINGFDFIQTLVPVKNASYRLFVNLIMMKGGKTALGEIANFEIEQNHTLLDQIYPMPPLLLDLLEKHFLREEFYQLSATRKKDILKYLFYVKTEETLLKNIEKVIKQLLNKEKKVRIP